MRNTVVQVIRFLSESLINEIHGAHSHNARELSARFIVEERKKMAYIVRIMLDIISLYLNLEPIIQHRKVFIHLSVNVRSEILKQWLNSSLSIKRQFMKLHMNLALLSFYDSEETTDMLGIDRSTYLRSLSFYTGAEDD